MTVYYLDPEGGNDASDGLSYATRKQSISSVSALAAAGDTVRMIASPDASSLGAASWTDGSTTITIATAHNATIDLCETAWTAATNVTATTTTTRKQGSNACQLAIASAFTTGKLAYKTLASMIDLSAYQQVALWVRSSTTTAATSLTLNLCSDTTGDVVVNALPLGNDIAQNFVANQFQCFVLNNGAALGSNIASISLSATVDPGTPTLILDDIVACLAPTDANCLTMRHLIGKNTSGEPEWYSIGSIDNGTVMLGGAANTNLSSQPPRNYKGTSESVTTYARRPLYSGALTTANRTWNSANDGTAASHILLSGGWNRTDMSTQTGETWVSGAHNAPYFASLTGCQYIDMEKLGIAHFATTTINATGTVGGFNWNFLGVVACGNALNIAPSVGLIDVFLGNVMQCQQAIRADSIVARTACNRIRATRISACTDTVNAAVFFPSNWPSFRTPIRFEIGKMDNHGGYYIMPGTYAGGRADIIGTTFDTPSSGILFNLTNGGNELNFFNCTIPGNIQTVTSFGTNYDDQVIRVQKLGGDATANGIYGRLWKVVSQTAVRHTASGLAWQMTLNSSNTQAFANADTPMEFPLAVLAFDAGSPVSCTCYVQRAFTESNAGLKIKGGYVAGVPNDVTVWGTAATDGTTNNWEQVTLTFTPTEAGSIELFGVGYLSSGSGESVYFDDLGITQ